MKKKISLLLLALLLIIPNTAKASRMCSSLRIVTNPNGVDINCDCESKEVKHLNQNEIFYVISDGNSIENCTDCLINTIEGEYYTIKNLDGTRAPQESDLTESFISKNYSKTDNAEGIIYSEKGLTEIRKGPGENYDIIGNIENDTKINYTYLASNNCIKYAYVNYNNIKGWIKYEDVQTKGSHKYIATKDVNIGCATIPKNTIINTSYIVNLYDNYGAVIEYDNCKKVITDSNSYNNYEFLEIDTTDTKINAKEDITVYEYYNNTGKELITIPKDQEYTYYAGHWITDNNSIVTDTIEYVSYNGIDGWIKISESKSNNNITKNDTTDVKTIGAETKEPNYITYYIIACSVIIIITIIVIVLINKKKNKTEKKEDNKKED